MHALWKYGFLDGAHSIFDYGCGRGDDLATLEERNLKASGWDPHFRPEAKKQNSDVVNLGYVLNVIEKPAERKIALKGAFSLCQEVLAVSVLIGGRTAYEKHRLFNDGVLTQRGTFQKYYTQTELKEYIREVLRREPVSISPGLVFVFKKDEAEQAFLAKKQRSKGIGLAKTAIPTSSRQPQRPEHKSKIPKWEAHPELLADFWKLCLRLGRQPKDDEIQNIEVFRSKLGSSRRIYNYLMEIKDQEEMVRARRIRKTDNLVYLALNFFERRSSFSKLPKELQRDIREHWGNFSNAQEEARQLLFTIGNQNTILQSCKNAADKNLGLLKGEESLTIDASLVNEVPSPLRVYIGCAAVLYGSATEADVIEVQIKESGITLRNYDDFHGTALPLLIEEIKIDFRKQRIQFFDHGDSANTPIYMKSAIMHPSADGYENQQKFDEKIRALLGDKFIKRNPSLHSLNRKLKSMNMEMSDLI